VDLKTHLDKTDCDEDLRQLVLLFGQQSKKITEAFITQWGEATTENIYGEKQVAMDVWADELLIKELSASGLVSAIASEEQPDVIKVEDSPGKYSVAIDPLDGSSLIGVNLAVGTIVGIYEGDSPLKKGNEMIGAMYMVYGPLTSLTYTLRNGVHSFILNSNGEFILRHENQKIPESGKIYAPGALRKDYLPAHKKYIEKLEEDGFKLRYSGSFVADVHQILHKGGVFTYPAFEGHERGKLRLLFEANPMGMIISEAGGAISTGHEDILSITPSAVSDRVPIYIGGKPQIEMIEKYMKEN